MQITAKSHAITPKKAFRSIRFHALALLFGLVMLYPLLWMFASSLKPNEEVFTTVASLIPSRVMWENYKIGWESSGRYTYATYFGNSLIIAVFSTIGGVVSSSLVAFGFATLIVTDDCPYTDEEIFAVGSEISLSVCKAYKEIPGLPQGDFDRDAIFSELVKKIRVINGDEKL